MYDTLVLGNDPGSLVAAVTLANRGRKTLLITGDAPQSYTASGYTFDIDPFPWTGFNRGHAFRQFVSHLGIPQDDLPQNPMLQIIFPDHRVELRGTAQWDSKEVAREFPGSASEINSFYNSLTRCGSFVSGLIDKGFHLRASTLKEYTRRLACAPSIAIRKRAFATHLNKIRQSPSLNKMLDAQVLLLSHLDPRAVSPFACARILGDAMQGLTFYGEGKDVMVKRLLTKFEADGGDIEKRPFSTFETERVIKVGIKTDSGTVPTVYGRNLIISTCSEEFVSLIENTKQLSSLKKRYGKIRPSLHPFTLYLGVDDRCIPEQMESYVSVIAEETGPIAEGNMLFLETSEEGNALRAPEGKRAITITAFLSQPPSESTHADLEKTAKIMLKNLEVFLPFLKDNIEYFNLSDSITMSREHRGIPGPRYHTKNPFTGMALLDNRTPLKNVFLTGNLVSPGLGFEGEIFSGIHAAQLATGR